MLILRELTGGLYFGEREEMTGEPGARRAVDSLSYTEPEIARIVRLAFELARDAAPQGDERRQGERPRDVPALAQGGDRGRRRVPGRASSSTGSSTPRRCSSSAGPPASTSSSRENLFGDILSDEASVLAGSLGMLPSASVGSRRTVHGLHGLYEPIHGSAPDIAGKDLANPIGTILSGAMMLRWSFDLPDAAAAIEDAVTAAIDDGIRTADLMPSDPALAAAMEPAGTVGMTDAILARLAGGGATASIS